jgi:transposase-like protein
MSVSYKYHRFPIEVILHCVWLYYTFRAIASLSSEDLEQIIIVPSGSQTFVLDAELG